MLIKKAREILEKIYNTPGHGGSFTSVEKLQHQLLKTYNITATQKDIQEWLNKNLTYSLHRRARYAFKRNPILATYIDEQWQIDLMFLPDIKMVTYIGVLICVDVASRYMWAEPIKNKSGKEVAYAMQKILDRASPRKPMKLQGDKGSEFYNAIFKKLLKTYDISELYSSFSDYKAAIVERAIRTFKEKLYRILDTNPALQTTWPTLIQPIVKSYNNTYHSTIKTEPANVTSKTVGKVLWNLYGSNWYEDRGQKQTKFEIGDYVRISAKRDPFHKGYKGKWKEEIFKVDKIKYALPHNVYVIKEWDDTPVLGIFYPYELNKVYGKADQFFRIEKILKTQTQKRKKEYLIRWSGWSEKYDSWEPESHMKDLPYASYSSNLDEK